MKIGDIRQVRKVGRIGMTGLIGLGLSIGSATTAAVEIELDYLAGFGGQNAIFEDMTPNTTCLEPPFEFNGVMRCMTVAAVPAPQCIDPPPSSRALCRQ